MGVYQCASFECYCGMGDIGHTSHPVRPTFMRCKQQFVHFDAYHISTGPILCFFTSKFYHQFSIKGANITGSYITHEADEELLKKMVYEHGAVVGTVVSSGPFSRYSKGIFAGCTDHTRLDHAITVVARAALTTGSSRTAGAPIGVRTATSGCSVASTCAVSARRLPW